MDTDKRFDKIIHSSNDQDNLDPREDKANNVAQERVMDTETSDDKNHMEDMKKLKEDKPY